VFGYGQELDVGEAEVGQVDRQLLGQLQVAQWSLLAPAVVDVSPGPRCIS